MRKENFRVVLRRKELRGKKFITGIELPWFAEKEKIVAGWLRVPQKVCYLGKEEGEREAGTFTLMEKGSGYFVEFPTEVREVLKEVVERVGEAVVELEFFLREEDEFEVDPTPAELRRAVLELVEEGAPLREVVGTLLGYFVEKGEWELEIKEGESKKFIASYFDGYSKLEKEMQSVNLSKVEDLQGRFTVFVGRKGNFSFLLADFEKFLLRAKIPNFLVENRDPRFLVSYLEKVLELYKKKGLRKEKEDRKGEPLREFLAKLRNAILDLLEKEIRVRLGTFSIVFFKLYTSPRPHYKYFFDAEQQVELERRIKDPRDPLKKEDIDTLLSFEYGREGSYSYYVVKSSISSYVPAFRKLGVLEEKISEVEGKLFLMDKELDTFQIGIPVYLGNEEWPTFIIWILGVPQAPALSPVTVAKVKQLVYSVIPAFKMAYELYVKIAELESLKGQQSADYFIVHNLPKVFTLPLFSLADFLEKGKVDLRTAAKFIRTQAELGEVLIAEFAAIERGEELREVSLKELLEEAVNRVKATLSLMDLLNAELFGGEPPKRKFPELKEDVKLKLLKNALLNALFIVLDNAYKYGAKNVEVDVKREGGYVKISFKDDGEGIPGELLLRLKERLREIEERGEEAFKLNVSKRLRGERSGGMGVGLQLVQRLLLRHEIGGRRGFLEIDSEGEGKGTTVTLNVPVEVEDGSSH